MKLRIMRLFLLLAILRGCIMAKTVVERQADLRKRRLEAGFRQLNEWVHDLDRALLASVAKELRTKRGEAIAKAPEILKGETK